MANSNARILVMGPQTVTWLQIFGEVASNLPKRNFTGLSRHYASKASALIARKLNVSRHYTTRCTSALTYDFSVKNLKTLRFSNDYITVLRNNEKIKQT